MRAGGRPNVGTFQTAKPAALRRISQHGACRTGIPDKPPGLALRLGVRVHRFRLDRELADGRTHAAAEERALRARQLAQPATRRALAHSLRRISADVEKPRTALFSSRV